MKKIKYIALAIGTLFFLNNKVYAGGSLSVSTGQVYVGDSFTTTVSLSGVASWNVHVSASGPVSGCSINAADATESATNGSKVYSVKCTSTGTGTITVSLSGDVTTEAGANSGLSGSRSVSVVSRPSGGGSNNSGGGYTKKTTKKNNEPKENPKSDNNYLKSLEIEGYKINPEFNKDTTDYTLTVPNGTNKVKIVAYKDFGEATISGHDGEVEVKEGENKLSLTVTAENGSKRTYNITVNVELKPIVVKLNGKDYSLVRNKDELPKLDVEHSEMNLNFDGQEVPAYIINKIGYMLVGLRDEKNNINLYRYVSYKADEKPAEYHLVNFLKVRDMNFISLEFPKNKIPSDYKKYTIKINDKDIDVYKDSKDSKYSLIYAINIETGKKNIYRYEATENTIQLHNNKKNKLTEDKTEQYKKFIMVLGGTILILLLLTTIGFTRKPKNNKKSVKKEKITSIEDEDELSKKDIKKIEKNTKKETKKQKKKQKKGEPEL